MRIGVIGAGIVGVTTAYELASDGHDVTVFERRGTVAEETSFANAGVVAPGYVTPWAAPGMTRKVLGQMFGRHAAVRLAMPWSAGQAAWLWRWWRACTPASYARCRGALHRLASYSRERQRELAHSRRLDYEHSSGYMVLLRGPAELAQSRAGLKLMAELGAEFKLVDGARAREIEPGLSSETALHAAVHLPADEVGNCRQFAHLLKQEAQKLGVRFRFHRQVTAVEPGATPSLAHAPVRGTDEVEGATAQLQDDEPSATTSFDAVIVCAAVESAPLLRPLGLRLPLLPVHGYSVTLPLRVHEGPAQLGPRSGVMDERFKVAISRLGQRVRVAGSAELGGTFDRHTPAALSTLYKVLDDWFPGCAQQGQAQAWKGARPMLPDGPPLLGPSRLQGVWFNLGHGSSGWALACGSARVVADLMSGRAPAISLAGLEAQRLG